MSVACPAGAGGGSGLSPEEEAAYEEFKEWRKAERQLQRDEHKRRRTFDPLSPRRAQAPKVSSAPTAPGSDSGDSATTAPSQGPPAARPRMAPGQLAAAAAQPAASDPRSGAPADEDIAALLTSMLADGGVPEVEVLADDEEELEQQLRQRETRAAAEEAARRRSRVAVPARRRRMTPMQLRAAAVMQAAQAAAAAEAAAPAPPAQRAPSAAAAGGPAAAGNSADDLLLRQLTGADDFEDEDELDWDALGQFEQFEEAAKRERQQQEQQRARRERQQQQGRASAPAAALAANPAARAPGQQQRGQQQQAQPSGALERDMDELEGLLGFFEAMETKPQRQAASKGGSGGGGAAGGDDNDIDWAKLESALFGDAWEEDLIAELAAELEGSSDEGEEDGEDGAKAPRGAGAAAADGGRGEEEVEPWADEVSTLLLGLVMQSHQKYLERPLLDEAVSEDQRAAAVWSAPFVLVVLDDSSQQQLEYSNAAASELFGKGYLDLFGTAGHELVAADEASQAEWAFALREADESYKRHAIVPRLALTAAGGRRAVARDVAVFRVDSLEDTPVGQAVLIRDWSFE